MFISHQTDSLSRCKRKPHTQCSPSEGPCCSHECRFVNHWESVQCKHEEDCTMSSKCDGQQAICPKPQAKPDNVTECNKGTQVRRDSGTFVTL